MTLALSLTLTLGVVTTADARPFWGWERISDGYSYVDSGGCIHQVVTERKTIFWIGVKVRRFDIIVAC
jgi:hypothetical protein